MIRDTVAAMLAPLARRLRLLVTRGVLKLIDDAPGIQVVQVTGLAGEVLDGVERIQQYGLTSHPHPGADAIILNVGANRAHPVVIAVDDRRYRLHLAPGEVAIYDDQGQMVKLARGGIVTEAPKGHVHNGDLTITGQLTVNGSISATGDVTAGGISLQHHVHGGIQPGGGTTGGPQ